MPKGMRIPYSKAEMQWLSDNRTMVICEYHAAFCAEFGRTDVTAGQLHSLRKRKGWKTGRSGRFKKGAIAHNKGKRCVPGTGGLHPNAVRRHFRKGSRSGKALAIYKPIGTERLNKEGYRERKVHDGLPMQSRWRTVQHINWEAEHGPVPKGMVLKCVDGDKLNTDPSNWMLVPRALMPRLNGGPHKSLIAFDDAPDDLKPVILAVAKLDHRIRSKGGGR